MGKSKKHPFSGRQCVKEASAVIYFDKFFILKRKSSTNETFHSVSPFLVEKAISGYLGEIPSVRKLCSGDLLVEVNSQKQAQIIIKLNNLASIPVTVTPHPSLNFSKGVVSCGELLNTSIEEIADKLKSQGVTHVRRISMRKGEQLLDTKHLVLTFHGSKIPESIKAGYMKLAVRHYFPNPLRCFKCQRFGHSKASCRGTPTCARCAEAGHDSSDCKASEKCVNCKGSHTSFSRLCSAWKFEKEVIAEKVKNNLSYIEARRIVKSRTPTLLTSYATAAQKKLETTNSQILPPSASVPFKASYTPSEICPRFIDPVLKLFLTDTHKETVSSQSKFPESNKNPPDFSDFKTVTNRKKLKKDFQVNMDNKTDNASQNYKTPELPDKEKVSSLKLGKNSSRPVSNSVIKTSHTTATNDGTKSRVHSVDTVLLPMAVLPPLEKIILQSRESDADAEMSSSSASEGDTLEYDMSEDLEDTPENVCPTTPPPPSTARKR
ncbi:hypothetical protein AVEN_234928-1 [Araneus ventricosus]|uniref:CCHC-type domain-containing protein n=1 Tax=Araneus ventricosus TaxID=182803 RepID=A0A4Y2W3N0_ARAVE|nr:hypothetical protein AVEN_234928-1 [Araneus ventricosus]